MRYLLAFTVLGFSFSSMASTVVYQADNASEIRGLCSTSVAVETKGDIGAQIVRSTFGKSSKVKVKFIGMQMGPESDQRVYLTEEPPSSEEPQGLYEKFLVHFDENLSKVSIQADYLVDTGRADLAESLQCQQLTFHRVSHKP